MQATVILNHVVIEVAWSSNLVSLLTKYSSSSRRRRSLQ